MLAFWAVTCMLLHRLSADWVNVYVLADVVAVIETRVGCQFLAA
jgi:hypothetical protein